MAKGVDFNIALGVALAAAVLVTIEYPAPSLLVAFLFAALGLVVAEVPDVGGIKHLFFPVVN